MAWRCLPPKRPHIAMGDNIQAQQKSGPEGPLFPVPYRKRLALGELEGAAGLRAAVLLALHHASVAGEEAALLEHSAKLRFVEGERAGDAVAHGTGLAREAAAGDGGDDIVLAAAVRRFDGLLQDHLQNRPGEILGELL